MSKVTQLLPMLVAIRGRVNSYYAKKCELSEKHAVIHEVCARSLIATLFSEIEMVQLRRCQFALDLLLLLCQKHDMVQGRSSAREHDMVQGRSSARYGSREVKCKA